MKFEFLWFGFSILAFQLLLLTSYCVITMVGHKIPESRQLRGQVAVICFVVGAICAMCASYGYTIMYVLGDSGGSSDCGNEKLAERTIKAR